MAEIPLPTGPKPPRSLGFSGLLSPSSGKRIQSPLEGEMALLREAARLGARDNMVTIDPSIPLPTEAKPVPKPVSNNINIPLLKESITKRETGSYEDPYIFTNVNYGNSKQHQATAKSGQMSSAYGPAQITYSLAESIYKKLPKDTNTEFKNYLIDFIQQGKDRINSYQNNPDAVPKSLRGGGSGKISKARHLTHYDKLFDLALKEKGLGKLEIDEIARRYYGNTDKEKSDAYVDAVLKYYYGQ